MEHLVACSSVLYRKYAGDSRLTRFQLDSVPLHFALMQANQPVFDPHKRPLDVLVRKQAFSCNYRDKGVLFTMNGQWNQTGQALTKGFGSEFAAEVMAIGEQVTLVQPGDLVITNVSYPYTNVVDVKPGIATNHGSQAYDILHESKLVLVPKEISLVEAAAFSIGATTARSMIRRLSLQPGDRVLVTSGRSNTSLFVLAMLKFLGLKVYTICSQSAFDERFRKLGVERVFHFRMPLTSEAERNEWQELSSLKPTVIIDPFFDLHLPSAMEWLDYGGRYITCGLFNQYFGSIGQAERAQQYRFDGMQAIRDAMRKNISIVGNCIGLQDDLQQALADAVAGRWHLPIDSIWQGAEGVKSFLEQSFVSDDRFGKVVFQYDMVR